MYAVTGTRRFTNEAFVPVVKYLRTTLGIPDAPQRQQAQHQRAERTSTTHQQWSLAMDPFTCNTFSSDTDMDTNNYKYKYPAVLPFFDVLVINTRDDLQKENNKTEFWDPSTTIDTTDPRRKMKKEKKNKSAKGGIIGNGPLMERNQLDLRNYVKAMKVKALQFAPFPITLYIDVDMLPCREDFGILLLQDVKQLAQLHNMSSFDIALTDVGFKTKNHSNPLHYRKIQPGGNDDMNKHRSSCVVLNMTSFRTIELLRRNTEHYFSTDTNNVYSKELVRTKVRDQPSMGTAIYDTWQFYKDAGSGDDQGFRHVDIDKEKVCHNGHVLRNKASPKHSCHTTEGQKGSGCILVHKDVKN